MHIFNTWGFMELEFTRPLTIKAKILFQTHPTRYIYTLNANKFN